MSQLASYSQPRRENKQKQEPQKELHQANGPGQKTQEILKETELAIPEQEDDGDNDVGDEALQTFFNESQNNLEEEDISSLPKLGMIPKLKQGEEATAEIEPPNAGRALVQNSKSMTSERRSEILSSAKRCPLPIRDGRGSETIAPETLSAEEKQARSIRRRTPDHFHLLR